jgi:sensor domain CHASE-containing protein
MEFIGVFLLGAGIFFVLEVVYDHFLWRTNANKSNEALRAELAHVNSELEKLRAKVGGGH